MIEAVVMYGSRARGDSVASSDTDLIGITNLELIQKSFDREGLSFHAYPLAWMLTKANEGNLFLAHVVNEAIAVYDPTDRLGEIRDTFRAKESYNREIEVGSTIVAAALTVAPADFSETIRRRYFWGLRTMLMARAADLGAMAFSAGRLAETFGMDELRDHIHGRSSADVEACRRIGRAALRRVGGVAVHALEGSRADNLRFLLDEGGIASVAAAEIIYGF